ncbi:MAG: hypothetical protein HYZ63_01515 [Candidatus Andersenbacteria bacterium]|nr:hypothetical protein [Candidatus Andersenbacteria bacterium]
MVAIHVVWKLGKKDLLVGTWLAGLLVVAGCLVWAPRVPQWGQLHQAHAEQRWQRLGQGEVLYQTFTLEYPRVDTVAVWVGPGQNALAGAALEITVLYDGQRQVVAVPLTYALSDGLLVARLPAPIGGKIGRSATLELRLQGSATPLNVQFQIDSVKYTDGEMSHSARSVKGDLAFQIHYERYALGTLWKHWLYASFLLAAGMVVAWVVRRPTPFSWPLSRQDAWVAAAVAAVVVCFYGAWLLFWPGAWIGPGDFVKDVAYIAASSQALRSAAWPAWSHATCGGMPLLGNPEGNTLSLATLFAFAVPAEKALWLLLALEPGMGAAGVYVLARMWGVSRTGSVLAAVVGVGSAAYPYRIVEGFSMIGGAVAFMPWALVGFWQALKAPHVKYAALSGFSLAFIFWRGEVHILTALLICLLVWALVAVIRGGRPALMMVVCVAALFFLAASPKLLPYLEQPDFFSRQYKPYVVRLMQDGLLHDVLFKVESRFSPVEVRHGRSSEEWANFGSYVGWLPLLLAFVGLCTRRRSWWIVSGGLLLSFVLAEGTLYDVWLRQVGPMAGLMRLPVRGLALTFIFLGMLSGAGLDALRTLFPSWRLGAIVAGAFVVAIALDLAAADSQVFVETLWPRTQVVATAVSSAILAKHDNASPGGLTHAGVLLRDGYWLPLLCADILAEPEFAKRMPATLPLAAVPMVITPNHIRLSASVPAAEHEVLARFDSAWVSPQAFVLPGAQGQMRIIPFVPYVPVDLWYIHALTRVEGLILCLVFVLILGMILF